MVELPLVVCDIQRGGPSTGLPTKTEQSDLLMALYGRHGEAPVPVVAPATPVDCFYMVFEAARLAIKYMTPVLFLSDGYLANGSEPWLLPPSAELPNIPVRFWTEKEGFFPYLRDEKTLARPWALPGTPGLEHRIGGLEKQHITGNVNYEPANHDLMVHLRAEKVERVVADIPPLEVEGNQSGDLLVLGWGSTHGAIKTAVTRKRAEGKSVSHAHLRYLNPFPRNLGEVLYRFKHVLIPEINLGQLVKAIRAKYLVPAVGFNKVEALPFRSTDIEKRIDEVLEG
jgi:2-oxoglutarate ferredoxin oxidoreductase subunit alpha